ncbi:MBL fold metallo-hydrolase [Alkalithermobacter paradoxus]|uniref:Putative metallo-hydrolase n=1 Tax=Alkalithermobacter paradoxus TaxID=29349 RepID=A0A1V4IAV0_9FIRM|nr:putative metallo-hydrolase [[Clostridium] thermoalcaliphilum]
MIIKKIVAGIYGVNCYIIGDNETKKCAVIDPGGNHKEILDEIDKSELDLEYIILTHGHGDHIGAVKELKDSTDAKILAHKEEKYILNNKEFNLTSIMSCEDVEIEADIYLNDKDKIGVGNLELEIIHTPGHTPGCICIKVGDVIFTGDTLFAGSIGRTDLEGGDYNTILNSLDKLAKLQDDLTVFPGHGPATRIGIEKVTNSFINNR